MSSTGLGGLAKTKSILLPGIEYQFWSPLQFSLLMASYCSSYSRVLKMKYTNCILLIILTMKIHLFCDVKLCRWMGGSWLSKGTKCFRNIRKVREQWVRNILHFCSARNIRSCAYKLQNGTAEQNKRLRFACFSCTCYVNLFIQFLFSSTPVLSPLLLLPRVLWVSSRITSVR